MRRKRHRRDFHRNGLITHHRIELRPDRCMQSIHIAHRNRRIRARPKAATRYDPHLFAVRVVERSAFAYWRFALGRDATAW